MILWARFENLSKPQRRFTFAMLTLENENGKSKLAFYAFNLKKEIIESIKNSINQGIRNQESFFFNSDWFSARPENPNGSHVQ